MAGEPLTEADTQLQVRIDCDEAAGTITFVDTGIGMNRQELVDHLGTIARSGSKAFMQRLKEQSATSGSGSSDIGAGIIGQFGVGFYSAFMVADRIDVFTRSAAPGSGGLCWSSAGDGSYTIAPAEGVARGSKIVVHLKDSCRDFARAATVKDVLARYSSFLSYPLVLDGKQVNTVQAIWAQSKSSISEDQYTEFYKYKSGDFEAPLYRLHFQSDAPIELKALLFVGKSHEEKYGMGRLKPGVDLYSRKVLIQGGSPLLMPDWLRFVQGVVDSEDVPLNISRESMQDSALMRRLKSTLTRRVLRFIEGEARRDPDTYNKSFFPEFGTFLKEGAVTDTTHAGDIAKLLRFESSALPSGSLTSFDEYIARMPPGQSSIYYLVAPHRGIAEASPYLEAFRGKDASAERSQDVEVLFLFSPIDDFVMNNLREFGGRKLVTAEAAEVDPTKLRGAGEEAAAAAGTEPEAPKPSTTEGGTPAAAAPAVKLTEAQVEALGAWLVASLPTKLAKVRSTGRLRNSPAVVTDHESAAVRRMMRLVEQTSGRDSAEGGVRSESHFLPKQTLEINPSHPVITGLAGLKDSNPPIALLVAEQVVDNALVAAGLVDDSRTMLPRLNALLESLVGAAANGGAAKAPAGYVSEGDLTAKRHVSAQEADEAAGIDAGQRVFEGLRAHIDGMPPGAGNDAETATVGGNFSSTKA